MNLLKSHRWLALWLILFSLSAGAARRKVYMTYVLHGNMNYDRYVRPTIWREFPVIYDGLLDFMDEHPDFKGQVQFSGQTLGSLLKAAPEVVEHALRIHRRGQLNFTGTFYSEPVNVNMDGETNYRCAWLGTRIVEDITGGKTDGFYLQERAFHPQLPYILNHSNVSWTPVITNDDSWRPFRLRGLDGSTSVCVPITRGDFIEQVKRAPAGSLITVEEDYEIPQAFTHAYDKAVQFNREQKEIQIEWITVKEYIKRFGTDSEKFVDHSAKARNRENGTYSRWTADPLDIRVQESTNRAMNDLRAAKIVNALSQMTFGTEADQPFDEVDIALKHDPLVWNIERADLYPNVEPRFLARRGRVTLLSKAEHLLLWGVNSDAKGWYPLYEKRRERINALENSSLLSRHLIHRAMDMLASQLQARGYDKYFLAFNAENARTCRVSISTDCPYDLYEVATGKKLPSLAVRQEEGCELETEVHFPSYGYMLLGARKRAQADCPQWTKANRIEKGGLSLEADSTHVLLMAADGRQTEILLDSFMIHPLAEMNDGKGDDQWRPAQEYGTPRIAVCTSSLYPQLRIERQPDWLVHTTEIYTLMPGKVLLDICFDFPHPTLVRKQGKPSSFSFSPEGLDLLLRTHAKGTVAYDIPYGISEYAEPGVSYFCPLTTLWLQHGAQGGLMVSPQTGEQAFSADLDRGQITLYMGASTTSGPIRDVGLTYKAKNEVNHELAWYAEPFHGQYRHRVLLQPYNGTWQEAQLPVAFRSEAQPVYLHECHPSGTDSSYSQSFVQVDVPNVEITTMDCEGDTFFMRLNEREGRSTSTSVHLVGRTHKVNLPPYGIATLSMPSSPAE